MNHEPLGRELDLDAILAQGRLFSEFQPIVSMRDQTVAGYESLVRARGAHGLVPPGPLFTQAARQGRTVELDRAARSAGLTAFSGQARLLTDKPLMWLNLETSILDQVEVGAGALEQAVRDAGLEPGRLVIEIVESKVRENTRLLKFVEHYRNHGFYIALDDVGAGFSNLERVALIRPDIIKVDRAIIAGLDHDFCKRMVLGSLTTLARGLGALVVAEGVETAAEAMEAMEQGVDLMQGFYFARPAQRLEGDKCLGAMAGLGQLYAVQKMEKLTQGQRFMERVSHIVDRIAARLGRRPHPDLDVALKGQLSAWPEIEALYVLDKTGRQLSRTALRGDIGPRARQLRRPAQPGADLSLKEYFLAIRGGMKRYVSPPYISQASGRLCVTASRPLFLAARPGRAVLCADYELSATV